MYNICIYYIWYIYYLMHNICIHCGPEIDMVHLQSLCSKTRKSSWKVNSPSYGKKSTPMAKNCGRTSLVHLTRERCWFFLNVRTVRNQFGEHHFELRHVLSHTNVTILLYFESLTSPFLWKPLSWPFYDFDETLPYSMHVPLRPNSGNSFQKFWTGTAPSRRFSCT